VFDPVAVLHAVKSGLVPSGYTLLRPDPSYFKEERRSMFLGRVVAIFLVAPVTFVGIPFVFEHVLSNPLARAGVYFIYWSVSLWFLAEVFVSMPRRLARENRQVLILTPDGLILADYEHGEVLRTIDYRAIDKLRLDELKDGESPDIFRLFMTEHGKIRRWTIPTYFEAKDAEIGPRVMRDYARAKERG
jgi:hypothetical protein